MVRKVKNKNIFLTFAGLIALAIILVNAFNNLPRSINILPKDKSKTIGWKFYENPEYRFSFNYPDGLLSNFQVNTTKKSISTLEQIANIKKGSKNLTNQSNSYNVIFEADAWKYKGRLADFKKNGPLGNLSGNKEQTLMFGKIKGLRISNLDKKSDVHFEYNFFKNGDYIYNFALVSDDPVLIPGNQALLDKIISTARFK